MSKYTKQLIATNLKDMMNHKLIEHITVTELVEKCDINRQTFYYHFKDIYDLLGWIYKTEAVGAIANSRSYDTWNEGLEQILTYVETNKAFCISTYKSLGKDHLEMFLAEVLGDLLGGVLDEVVGPQRQVGSYEISKDDRAFILRFYCSAFSGILLYWIGENLKTPKEEVWKKIEKTMDNRFVELVERFST